MNRSSRLQQCRISSRVVVNLVIGASPGTAQTFEDAMVGNMRGQSMYIVGVDDPLFSEEADE
jgi:hypothetical protein